jgi:glycosyltransferase involved in cell wall biosynthesis
MEPKRLLLIAYAYPPVGGAGVQRAAKFVKYLPAFGWVPSVLTVANPSVPLRDESLTADVSENVVIGRARTWEPSYAVKSNVLVGRKGEANRLGHRMRRVLRRLASVVLQPDPQILWLPDAIRVGWGMLRATTYDAIMVSGPPFSSFLVGDVLARRSRLPLVLDYRDEWTLTSAYGENRSVDGISRWIQTLMQNRVTRAARVLLATTRQSAEALEVIRARAGSGARVSWIYNGYDPDDFPDIASRSTSGTLQSCSTHQHSKSSWVFRVVYVGTLWNLTSVAPLVQAVCELAKRSAELAKRLELVFAGRRMEDQQRMLDSLQGLPCSVVLHPYLDHREAVELARSADALCLLMSDLPGAGRVVPAKLFEYLAARRPIIAIAPRGEVWELLGSYPGARLFLPQEVAEIADCLAREIEHPPDVERLDFSTLDVSQYSRPYQAGQLATVLNSIAG